jgi:Fe-S oxidoreductase
MNEFISQVRSAGPSPLTRAGTPGTHEVLAAELLQDLVHGPRLFHCLECGRCTGVCPVARHQPFSPRRLISRALSAGGAALAEEPSLWTCLTCNRCQAICPTGVDYDRFILTARAAVVAATGSPVSAQIVAQQDASLVTDPAAASTAGAASAASPTPPATAAPGAIVACSHGGVFEQINLMMVRPGLRQKRLDWVTDDLKLRVIPASQTDKQRVLKQAPARAASRKQRSDLLYVGCSPYFAAYFDGETGAGLTDTMRSAVRLLNRAGITPGLLENERCCGYHLRLSGRVTDAEALEERVLDQLQRSGAYRIITFCPECLIGLRQAATRRGISLDVVHLSTVLWGKRAALPDDADAASPEPAVVTYQDPCRLGRYARIYDPPRDLLREVGGTDVAEMAHHRRNAICCGNTAWLNCNAGTKRLQTARLDEAVAAGGDRLLTACPGCYIHLRCAQEGLEEQPAGSVAIEDIWSYLERRLSGRPPVAAEQKAPSREAVAAGDRRGQTEDTGHE